VTFAVEASEAHEAPRYRRVRAALRQRIESGVWRAGDQIPPEPELVRLFGVSRGTLRQAVDVLVREGHLKRIQGLGTFVRRAPAAVGFLGFFHLYEDLRERGYAVALRVVAARVVPAEPDVATLLEIPAEAPLVGIRRLVLLDGEPFRLEDYYAPHDRFARLLDEDLGQEPLSQLVQRRYGVHFTRLQKWLEPVLVHGEEAGLLDLQPGDPVLRIDCLAHGGDTHFGATGVDRLSGADADDGSEPIDFRRIYMRGDKCRFFVEVEER
jgi:GntR family transcriptional regulator